MSGIAIAVLLLIAVPAMLFGVWQVLQASMVRVDSGTVGLLIVRGVATDRVLEPGVHFVLPFRKQMIQGYPLRDMTYLTVAGGVAETTDYADAPMRARLGDHALVTVSYTVRFRIRPDGLPLIHEHTGLEGIKRLVRDETQRAVLMELGNEQHGVGDAFGAAREQMEAAVGTRVTAALSAAGFETVLFSLRELDLGTVGDVVDATVRAKAELDLERAAAEVRALRVLNDSATEYDLGTLTPDVLRYRQIELGREAVQRWDGRSALGESVVHRFAFPDTAPVGPANVANSSSVAADEDA